MKFNQILSESLHNSDRWSCTGAALHWTQATRFYSLNRISLSWDLDLEATIIVWLVFSIFFSTIQLHKFKRISGRLALNVKLVSCGMINVVIWKLEFSLIIVSWEAETSIHQCPAWIPGPSVWQWSITSHSHHISWNAAASNIYQHQTHHPHQPAAQTANRRYLDHIKEEEKRKKSECFFVSIVCLTWRNNVQSRGVLCEHP